LVDSVLFDLPVRGCSSRVERDMTASDTISKPKKKDGMKNKVERFAFYLLFQTPKGTAKATVDG
jgi:hypothetical protein